MYDSFGFKANIFNVEPLGFRQEDLGKFIGRVRDIKSFAVDVSANDSATVLITGHRGVGKTSFVNIMEYAAAFNQRFFKKHIPLDLPRLAPCYHKIQIEPGEDVKSILLKSLSSVLFTIHRFSQSRRKAISKETQRLIEWISSLEKESEWSGQLSLAGFGGGLSGGRRYKSVSDIPVNILQEKIIQSVSAAKKELGIDGVFLNINNVDILSEKFFCDVFNQLRDYLLNIPGLWCVIIGAPGSYSTLFQQAARVAETVSGEETHLDPLSEEDVMSVLRVRQEAYSISSGRLSDLPIEEEFIREVYKNSAGEIRQIFRACDGVVRHVFKENPHVRVIGRKRAWAALKDVLDAQLNLKALKAKEREIIREILKSGSLRPKDYRGLKLKSAVDFTNKAARLLKKSFLQKEVRGNAASYKAPGIICLAQRAGVSI